MVGEELNQAFALQEAVIFPNEQTSCHCQSHNGLNLKHRSVSPAAVETDREHPDEAVWTEDGRRDLWKSESELTNTFLCCS